MAETSEQDNKQAVVTDNHSPDCHCPACLQMAMDRLQASITAEAWEDG